MHFYQHHIGDFNSATRHLTRIERSVYRDLLDLYYGTERQLTLDRTALCRRVIASSNEESTAVEQVLNEFFTETPTGWFHARCEAEIEAYKANSSQRAVAGKASAEAKRRKKLQAMNGEATPVEQPLSFVATADNGASTNHNHNHNHNHKHNHKHNHINTDMSSSDDKPNQNSESTTPGKQKKEIPPLDYEGLKAAYHAACPSLPNIRVDDDRRRRLARNWWVFTLTSVKADGERRATTASAALDFARRFFERAEKNDFLTGRQNVSGPHAKWRADFDFLCSDKGIKHVLEKTQ
jgi:uncharacterized protein YdaU (DUF1376 family)